MNNQISLIVTILLNNRVIVADTGIKGAWLKMLKIEPSFWKYARLYARLQKNEYTTFEIEDKTYHIEIYRNK